MRGDLPAFLHGARLRTEPRRATYCEGYSSSNSFADTVVGHLDWDNPDGGTGSWNSAHPVFCDTLAGPDSEPGRRFYCFAID